MSNFLKNSNKAGLIGGGSLALGAVVFILWAIFGEADGVGGFFGNIWILSVALFVFGVIYLFAQSGRGQS